MMFFLSKVMLHPCLIMFIHRAALAALSSSPKSIKKCLSHHLSPVLQVKHVGLSLYILAESFNRLRLCRQLFSVFWKYQSMPIGCNHQYHLLFILFHFLIPCKNDEEKPAEILHNPNGDSLVLNVPLWPSIRMEF